MAHRYSLAVLLSLFALAWLVITPAALAVAEDSNSLSAPAAVALVNGRTLQSSGILRISDIRLRTGGTVHLRLHRQMHGSESYQSSSLISDGRQVLSQSCALRC